MLQLLSSILTWSDNQREQVGLQRASGLSAPGVNTSSARTGRGHARSGKGKGPEDGLGETEVSLFPLYIRTVLIVPIYRLSVTCGSSSCSKRPHKKQLHQLFPPHLVLQRTHGDPQESGHPRLSPLLHRRLRLVDQVYRRISQEGAVLAYRKEQSSFSLLDEGGGDLIVNALYQYQQHKRTSSLDYSSKLLLLLRLRIDPFCRQFPFLRVVTSDEASIEDVSRMGSSCGRVEVGTEVGRGDEDRSEGRIVLWFRCVGSICVLAPSVEIKIEGELGRTGDCHLLAPLQELILEASFDNEGDVLDFFLLPETMSAFDSLSSDVWNTP